MSQFNFYAAQLIDGIAYGSIYGIFGLSLVLLYRANKLFNFAQTEIATLLVFIALLFMKKFSYFVSISIIVFLAFLAGCMLHLGAMRLITERRNTSHSSEALVTIGFFTIFNSVSAYFFGDEPQAFPSPFFEGRVTFMGILISNHSIGILIVTILMIGLVFLGYRFTKLGLLFEAVAENISGARLRGIHASNILALAWGLSITMATIGGILIAPILYVTPNMLTNIFAASLLAVMIGGFESPAGALVGGLIIGVTENLASNIFGSELKFVAVYFLSIIILIIRPRGLWGRAEARRV